MFFKKMTPRSTIISTGGNEGEGKTSSDDDTEPRDPGNPACPENHPQDLGVPLGISPAGGQSVVVDRVGEGPEEYCPHQQHQGHASLHLRILQ